MAYSLQCIAHVAVIDCLEGEVLGVYEHLLTRITCCPDTGSCETEAENNIPLAMRIIFIGKNFSRLSYKIYRDYRMQEQKQNLWS